jgi:uncharacterized protein with HXXEE motif
VLIASRSGPRSVGAYSILVLYGVFAANALVPHLAGAIMLGGYVPGVITAVALMIPFTIWLSRQAILDAYARPNGLALALVAAAIVYAPAVAILLGAFD